ncbi:hypothetical protein B0J11DRAFT_582273 [Dendryphion nanum]|uniref:Uncharacterized protein n=1 Tax=Dendryphion nanum TaxID=256645 RepID=A0A9P9DIS6_9PLEO|nr:hypothetical protein B0J11DRAFT_582273 [Dendryphion nanum]
MTPLHSPNQFVFTTTPHLILSLLVLLTLISPIRALCYAPDGLVDPENKWVNPCSTNSSSPLSKICCQTGWDNPPGGDRAFAPTRDECLPNGLCQNRFYSTKKGEEKSNSTEYYRNRCTEKDWKTGACLDVCTSGTGATSVYQMMPCDGTSASETWCCGNTTDCCNNPSATVRLAREFVGRANLTMSSSSALPSSTSPTSAVSTAPSVATQSQGPPPTGSLVPDNPSKETRRNTIIGGVVGSIVGLALLGVGGWIWRRQKNKKAQSAQPAVRHGPALELGSEPKPQELYNEDIYELPPGSTRSEVEGEETRRPH